MRRTGLRLCVSRRDFAAAGLAAFGGIGILRVTARAATFSWKFSCTMSSDHPLTVRSVEAFAKVRDRTRGALDIKTFPNNALGDSEGTLGQLRLGALEMMTASGSVLDNIIPQASLENIGYAFPDQKTAFRAMDGDVGKLIRDQFPSHGFIAFDHAFQNGFRNFTSNTKPIRNAEDLQGMKVRAITGKLAVDTFRSLGAAPTPIPTVQLYSSLQTHIIEGADSPLPLIESQRWYEVQKYCALSHHVWTSLWALVSITKWNSLPRSFQDILRETLTEGIVKQRRDCQVLETSLRDKLQRQGMSVNTVDVASLKAKLMSSGYYGRWRTEYGPAAWATLEKYSGPLG